MIFQLADHAIQNLLLIIAKIIYAVIVYFQRYASFILLQLDTVLPAAREIFVVVEGFWSKHIFSFELGGEKCLPLSKSGTPRRELIFLRLNSDFIIDYLKVFFSTPNLFPAVSDMKFEALIQHDLVNSVLSLIY